MNGDNGFDGLFGGALLSIGALFATLMWALYEAWR